jgi:hypothetical protein
MMCSRYIIVNVTYKGDDNNHSIQFNSRALLCRVNSQMANYRKSTTQITTENEQDTNETNKTKQNKKNKYTKSRNITHI